MESSVSIQPIVTTRTETSWSWGINNQAAIIISVTLAVTITIEIIVKFFILRRKRKQLENYMKERMEELETKENEVFWQIIKRNLGL